MLRRAMAEGGTIAHMLVRGLHLGHGVTLGVTRGNKDYDYS